MFEFSLLHAVSALAVGCIVTCMAMVHSVKLKALIYSFPLPMTIAIIATGGVIGGSNVLGLATACGFLWLVYLLHQRHKIPIVAADVIAAAAYIAVAFVLMKTVRIGFYPAAILYTVAWAAIVTALQRFPSSDKPGKPLNLPVVTKSIGVTLISYLLFSAQNLLAGFVVTFPNSGVFVVIETKHHLVVLARALTRNSLAILGLFVTMYALGPDVHLALRLAAGWTVFGVMLKLLQKISV